MKLHFQEWEIRRINATPQTIAARVPNFEKIRLLRPVVKITREQADTLNFGRCQDISNGFFVVYLLPEEDVASIC